MKRFCLVCVILIVAFYTVEAQNPEPAGWYSGDMHVHRSCGGSPESVATMFNRMTPQNLAVVSQLADSGNGEVQDAATDLPLVNGQDDPISTPSHILHWDTEWHWDATYTQYPHQALGGHIVNLGLSSAQQIWQENTFPILDWAHQHNGIAGFAHLQYLDGNGLPSTLTCCTPIEFPVEVALGAADFISEDVDDVNWPGGSMYSETPVQAYYKLLNSGFRPGLAAGTDYPCNGADNGGALGGLLTYAQIPGGQLTYHDWIQGIANGRTVVSRNGHNEFLGLTVNGTNTPGDEIDIAAPGNVSVTVQWIAEQSWSGTIELVQNGVVVASLPTSAGPGAPATLTTTVNFAKSGWLAARRMGTNPQTGNYEHYVHTAAVFVIVNNAPIRASQADAQYFVNWTSGLLQNTSPGGIWNSFYPTSLAQAQARYQAAEALYQQIASEASGSGPTLNSIAVTPSNQTIGVGGQLSFSATGTYSSGPALNITGQVRWSSSNSAVATISARGLTSAIGPGSAVISATLSGKTSSTTVTVTTSPLAISTTSLAAGTVGVLYSSTMAATGGTLPYAWTIATGSLPTGLTLNVNSGLISGTPSAAGTFNFVVEASDSGSPTQAVSQALSITIGAPGVCPCSIWPSTATPQVADAGPDSAVELGVSFKSDISGYITGVRFYKSVANTGTHVGNLWGSGGTQLATATFSGESASGWQQVNFSAPVPITAGAVYVASYNTSTGHYPDDQNFFASQGVDNSPLHALQDTSNSPNGVYAYGPSSFPSQTWNSSNYWVDVVFVPSGPDTTPPTVQSVSPAAGASGVDPQSSITATFSEALDPTTVSGSSMQLLDASSTLVAATVTYSSATNTATLRPNAALLNSTTYTVILKGGIIKDVAGNALTSDYTWSFTTAAPTPPPPPEGPGGPILIVSSSTNPFSRYYTEVLRNEGFNEFTAMDVSQVFGSTLASYEVVILGNFALTPAQASMFTTWVNNGGNLIAMRPDKQLAPVLGLADTGTVLNDAYLLINTTSAPGSGLVNDTIQFHGNADRYTVNGATSLATLYSGATVSTSNPAVTLNQVGLGQAAAFTYDLAQSVVYTRQGNPAWSGQARDGQAGPIRSDDLYYGGASFDPEPDYVDHNKIAIPQADEQQRLLANLIIQMNLAKQPLPRFWYFPHDFKAAVVLTGDDHGALYDGGATATRFDHYQSLSPSGCSVSDWQCVRASAYLLAPSVADNPLTNAQAASYIAQGFEVGVHVDSVPDCSNWTPSQLASIYSSQISSFLSTYTSVPQPKTHRMHCIGWSDYDSQPQTELQNGIRLDTNYYYWPPSWVNDTPGMFTGSGMPMRFTKMDGTMLDIYQAATQMTDESGQSYPLNIDTLLDNAIGTNGYYGYFTANMHNDADASDGADAVIASAQSRGVPIISAAQLLSWLDGRNGSSFTSLAWSGSTLTFGIAVGSGANGLEAMLPASLGSATLKSLTLNGSSAAFTLETIKGISYAVFPAPAGTYQASYTATSGISIASVALNPSTVVGGTSSNGTVTLNGPAPSGGVQISLTTSDTATTSLSSSTVTVPQGATTATFAVNTNVVAGTTNVVISAMYGGNTVSSNLTITPIAAVTSLSLNPTTVLGGISSTATVTINDPAPSAGVVVNLSSSNTVAAQVPATITIDAGATTATFTVTTTPVVTDASLTISATLGTTQSASFTVKASALSSVTLNPTSVPGGTNSTGTVTLNGPAPTGGVLVTLLSNNTAAAQVPATMTVNAGATTATFAVTTSAVATNALVSVSATLGTTQSANLTVTAPVVSSLSLNPASVPGGNSSTGTVSLTGPAPAGGTVITLSSTNTAAAQVPANVTVTAGQSSATFAVTTSPVATNTSLTISATYGSTQTAGFTVTPTVASTVTLDPASVPGGASSIGTVSLNGAAPTGGAVVALSSSNTAAAQVPASVTVAAGATTATFTITTSGGTSNASVTISGTYGVKKTATLTVTASQSAVTITAASLTINFGDPVPVITATATGLTGGDTIATLAPVCTTTYTVTSVVGTYPTSCSGATNPGNKYSFTYVAGKLTVNPARATMISPVPGSTFTSTSQMFTWTPSGAANQVYALQISAVAPGGYEVYKSPYIYTTSTTVNVPTGKTLYVRLFSLINSAWQYNDYVFSSPPGVTITAASLTINFGDPVPVITATATGLTGGDTIATLAPVCTTTYTVTSVVGTYPTSCSGATNPGNKYSFTYVAGKLTVNPARATMISPVPGSTFTSTSQMFTWTPSGAADQVYALQISAVAPGGYEVYKSPYIYTTSTTVNVPTGKTLYVRLFSLINSAWQYNDYVFSSPPGVTITAASLTINFGDPVPVITATATGLTGGDTIATLAPVCTTTYTVTSVVGTYPTSCSGATNPGNKYSFTYVAGKLTVNPARATMISPVPGSTFTSTSQMFTWTPSGAANQVYALQISAVAPGGYEVYKSPYIYTTSTTVNVPTGKTLYVRLFSLINSAWQYNDYVF